jgi:prepilin-type N-terminal cleavage/methylation domain-containing protein
MRTGIFNQSLRSGFTLIEAMVCAALISVALLSSFSIIKILNSGRSAIVERTTYQRLSDNLFGQYRLILLSIQSSELPSIVNQSLPTLSNSSCPSAVGITIQQQTQTILCSVSYPVGMANYVITLSNTVTAVISGVRYLRVTVSFYSPTDTSRTSPVYQRVSYMVK